MPPIHNLTFGPAFCWIEIDQQIVSTLVITERDPVAIPVTAFHGTRLRPEITFIALKICSDIHHQTPGTNDLSQIEESLPSTTDLPR